MRDIIFRGKRIDISEWVYGDLVRDNIGGVYVFPNDAKGLYPEYKVNPETVGQYIGLTDMNGNKIFEGDIIAFNARRFANSRVFYYTRCSGFHLTGSMGEPKPCDIKPFFSDNCYRYEVIGNVFDNPELLKGGEE